EGGTRRRPDRRPRRARRDGAGARAVGRRRGDAVGLQGRGRRGRRRGTRRTGAARGAAGAADRRQGMRLAAAVLATVWVGAMRLARGGAARLRVSGEERAQLPHVRADGETQRRLAWAERDHASDGASWQFDVPDPLLGWRPRPGVHARSVHPGSYDVMNTIDAQGLRGVRDVAREKTPGVTRIAVFGCSQTFGSGVADDETFSARLE